jgi:hypothetical protein
MRDGGDKVKFNRNTGFREATRILKALISEWIKARTKNVRGWEAGEIVGPCGCCVGGNVGNIFSEIPTPHHLSLWPRKIRNVSKLARRLRLKAVVQRRNQQHLEANLWSIPVTREKRDGGS